MTGFYNVARESKEIVIRLSDDVFDTTALTKFLDYLELESIRRRNKMTQEQADSLAGEIDQVGWQSLKESFLKA